jgi:hypothetical protein
LAGLWLCLTVISAGITAFVVLRANAQDPQLAISQTGATELQITVTNAPTGAQYELQRIADLNDTLDPNFYWPTEVVGDVGQTNFVIEMGIFSSSYLRVLGCVDCDGDGTPNHQDGQPGSTNVGILSITIDSPLNGANIQ